MQHLVDVEVNAVKKVLQPDDLDPQQKQVEVQEIRETGARERDKCSPMMAMLQRLASSHPFAKVEKGAMAKSEGSVKRDKC